MALEGLLKHHLKHCVKKENECACYALSRDFGKFTPFLYLMLY